MVIKAEHALAMDPGNGKSKIYYDGVAGDIRTNKGNAQRRWRPQLTGGQIRGMRCFHREPANTRVHVHEADEKAKANKLSTSPAQRGRKREAT